MTGRTARQSIEAQPQREARVPVLAPVGPVDGSPQIVAEQAAPRGRTNPLRPVAQDPSRSSLIGQNWALMAPVMATGVILASIISHSIPALLSFSHASVAIALIAASSFFSGLKQDGTHSNLLRGAVMVGAVGLPMMLYGVALARWVMHGEGLSWETALGVLTIISMIAAIILRERLPTIIIGQIALWTGVALVAGTSGTFVVLGVGAAAGVFAAIRQASIDAKAAEAHRERRHAQLRAEEILRDYEQAGQVWFWETDRRGAITYVSPTVGAALGRKAPTLIGRPFAELFINGAHGQEGERTLAFFLTARSSFNDLAIRAATQSEERWWSVTGRPIFDSFNNFIGFRGSGSDLTEKKKSDETATRLAHYDSLTSLANRFQISQTLEKLLVARNLDHRACAVFLLDLDRFKQVNDTMGHPAGDSLLKQVAIRLEKTVGLLGRVGRLGGDEFQVILAGRHRRDDLADLARKIIDELSHPYSIDGHRVVIGVSIGIALSPEDGVTSEAIIRNADLALYAAKDAGRGRHHFYAADLHSDAEDRREMEQDLRDALGNGSLELYYQPVVHTPTEKITGFEALLRWNHPTKGPISPTKFIPIAEDTGLIAPIGEWALRTACMDLASWPTSVRVAVNVSPLQFANPALPSIVTHALAAAQLDPSRLELEITESVFLNDDEGTEAMFAALKRVGVRLALDDFGTGYSSLGYLKRAPFDKIKIDQSFVRGATIQGSRNGAIISAIVSLAEALGMETTAEGVETMDELDLVRMLGCSHVQGFIYAKPMSRDDATQQLALGLTAVAQGPRSARSTRQTMLRKITLDQGGQQYHGTIRNISSTGALVEGLWNVPAGTIFRTMIADGHPVTVTARWCQEDRMGVEFSTPLALDESGRIALIAPSDSGRSGTSIRRAQST